MKRRETIFLISGLVIGLLCGMILVGSNDDLRESLFGAAGTDKAVDVEYYLVDLEAAQTWLTDEYSQNSEQIKTSFDALVMLPVSVMPNADFKMIEPDIEYILPQAYAALVGEKDADKIEVKPNDNTSACLGLDDDPYEGTTLYFYLTIPTEKAKSMAFIKDWEKLKDPKNNVLYWKLLACFPELDEKS
jgi:hypothetical protein